MIARIRIDICPAHADEKGREVSNCKGDRLVLAPDPFRISPEMDPSLVGTWLSLVEHSLGVRGVGSSNLPVPTIQQFMRFSSGS